MSKTDAKNDKTETDFETKLFEDLAFMGKLEREKNNNVIHLRPPAESQGAEELAADEFLFDYGDPIWVVRNEAGEPQYTIYESMLTEHVLNKKTDRLNEKPLTSFPFYPVAAIDSAGDDGLNDHYVRIRFKTSRGGWEEDIVSQEGLSNTTSSKSDFFKLTKRGLIAGANIKSRMITIVAEMLAAGIREERIEIDRATSVCGWQSDWSHITPADARYAGNGRANRNVAGNPSVWRSVMREYIFGSERVPASPNFGAIMAYAVSGFLRGLPTPELNDTEGLSEQALLDIANQPYIYMDHSSILHLPGATSRGKTTASMGAASIVGTPDRETDIGSNIRPWSATLAGLESRLADNNHGFICLEEIHSAMHRDLRQVIMSISNAGGRDKGGGSNGRLGALKSWSLNIISNGNAEIDLGTGPQSEALQARVTQLDLARFNVWNFNSPELINRFTDILKMNHGHGYADIVDYVSRNADELAEEFKALSYEYSTEIPVGMEAQYRKLKTWLMVKAALPVIAYMLRPMGQDSASDDEMATIEASVDFIINEFVLTRPVPREEELRTSVSDWVMSNVNHFIWKGPKPSFSESFNNENPEQVAKNNAKRHNDEVMARGQIYGYIDTSGYDFKSFEDGIDFEVFIKQEGKKAAKRDADIDIAAIASEVSANYGWCQRDEKQLMVRRSLNGTQTRGYLFAIEQKDTSDILEPFRRGLSKESVMADLKAIADKQPKLNTEKQKENEHPF